ncbi:BREX-3 system phosphatase PglZ [Paenibacillus prosopidis]|uniref:PglZ domain-containing protein n=1 Tax=Paenibacillus prosopidis TaxID=630520 RepID=A0A368W8U2_9BACL|nr:BREX-3 system phosphatase PglZ [Paenibacillus prosopidis]RCW52055.1 PglZ domain-containing protein [Paenibacillus prosopidis]
MSKNWRQKVLEHFQAPFYHITMVSDPNSLLQDEVIVSELHKLGIEIVEFHDRATFRYWYESQYRHKSLNKFLLIRPKSDSINDIPYDVWVQGHQISLSKSELFPNLSASIVRELDSRTLDALSFIDDFPSNKSDSCTIDFLLRRIFKLSYDSIDTAAECILLCINRHLLHYSMPEVIEEYLKSALINKEFINPQVAVSEIFSSSETLFSFLQREWNSFLEDGASKNHAFSDPMLQNTLAGLFRIGILTPSIINNENLSESLYFGVKRDEVNSRISSIIEHISQIEKLLEFEVDRRGWIELIQLYSSAKSITFQLESTDNTTKKLRKLEQVIEERFMVWLNSHYGALASLTDLHAPVMLHKVAEYVQLQGSSKIAIIVMDGMSFVQWSQIRTDLQHYFNFIENGTFAWIPTITSVSRQAIFSGEIPRTYYASIHTTANEEKEWKTCWTRYGVSPIHISYEKSLGKVEYNHSEIKALSKSSTKVAGLVVDIIDKLTHNTIQGQIGMHSQISIWLRTGYLRSLLRDLLDAGFDVYITSDHGNKESVGIGAIREGVLANTKGERVRIYNTEVLRDRAAEKYSSQKWKKSGLPDEFHVLLAKSGEAYVKEGEVVVSHGGASIEEVIVPFVRVKKRMG